jgi:hypothetical protein
MPRNTYVVAQQIGTPHPSVFEALAESALVGRHRGRKRGLVEGVGGSGHWVLMNWGRLVRKRRRDGKLEGGLAFSDMLMCKIAHRWT